MPHATHHPEKIAILDCGAQYTKVIDRRLRQMNVETVLYPVDVSAQTLADAGLAGIILSGGPHSVYEAGAPACDEALFELGLPVLGICYGMQLMMHHFGGRVEGCAQKEYGETEIAVEPTHPLFKGLPATQQVLMSHGDTVTQMPPAFKAIAWSRGDGQHGEVLAAVSHESRPLFGLQFHPEVELSPHGEVMLKHFCFDVCGVTGAFTLEDRLETMLAEIRQQVDEAPVFVLVSGGVDSSVVAAALAKALPPEQVYAVHMNTGLMRENESDLVCDALKAIGLKHLKRLDAQDFFLNFCSENDAGQPIGPLSSATDPEEKRRLIGDAFFQLIDKEMRETLEAAGINPERVMLAQGTLRPDLIESGNREVSKTAHKIKTHHNDVPLIQRQREKGLVVEPNRDLHKDEVRQVGRLLGLPEALVIRQPFPGPGLGVRILCANEPYGLERYDELNAQLHNIIAPFGLRGCLLPVRTVGVQGDGRTYSFVAAIEAKTFDTAEAFQAVRRASREITNRLAAVNRVALNLTPKQAPLSEACKTITPSTLQPETIAQLQRVDAHVTQAFMEGANFAGISQLLSVLLPVDGGKAGQRSVAIRAVVTSDFMTARPAEIGREMPEEFLGVLGQSLLEAHGLAHVFYDVTSKPPATVEWE